MMRKKVSLGAAISFVAIGAAITFSLTMVFAMRTFNGIIHNTKEHAAMYEKLDEINAKVRNNYLGEINEDVLLDSIANGYMRGLGDKYASYYNQAEYAARTESQLGQMVGIGVSIIKDTSGYIKIKEVYKNSPAEQVGITKGDLIVKVADEDVVSIGYENALKKVKGEEGTKVKLVVRRETEEIPVEPTRRKVEVPTIYSKLIGNSGYIKITEFNEATATQFDSAVDKLIKDGAKALIFDVRNNPGGTIDSVSSMVDKLVPEGNIVSATYKNGKTEVLKRSDSKEIKLPMVVITNGNSASAAELFTQSLRDYEKAKIVGLNTFGKGIMQRTYRLNDGSAIEMTIAKYNPPKSENFHGVGIKPDYEVKLSTEQEKMINEMSFEELVPEVDAQLKKAIEVAEGLIKNKK